VTPSPAPIAPSATDFGATLLALARDAIAEALGRPAASRPPRDRPSPRLAAPGAAFVTLTEGGALRGCIGSLTPRRALADDVAANARAAAFDDPRFPPLARDDFDRIRVEVSVLSPLEPLPVVSEADALAKIRPGVDGLVLEWGRHRGTFLPQVWDDLPDPRDFLGHLKRKAGLPPDFWADDLRLSRYHVEKWSEPEPGPTAP